jgi:hypothetical protein
MHDNTARYFGHSQKSLPPQEEAVVREKEREREKSFFDNHEVTEGR